MNILGIIPARGGSKGIAQKNLAILGGKTLLAWACASAMGSRKLTTVIVSTDNEDIAAEARRCGVDVPQMRPGDLADDEAPMLNVVRFEVEAYRQRKGALDAVMILQPTSPFRTRKHIDEAIDMLEHFKADTVVSVRKVPHNFLPQKLMRREGDQLRFIDPSIPRRQDMPVLYARNGPAILLTRVATIDSGQLYGKNIHPLVMNAIESVDIDDEDDLRMAEALLTVR